MVSSNSVALVQKLLENPTDEAHVASLVAPTATYHSLSYAESNPWLTEVLPYAGLHVGAGPKQIASTFRYIGKIWTNESFEIKAIFGSEKNVAVFGTFVYKSRTLGKSIKSPFSIHCIVEDIADGGGEQAPMITCMQFLEDTLGTTGVFKKEAGYGTYVVDPETNTEVDL